VIKRQFGHTKVRYRGLKKNTAQLTTLFALSNLWMARTKAAGTGWTSPSSEGESGLKAAGRRISSVYFCDPHSPWQRGTCENTNGLHASVLAQGNRLSASSAQDELDAIADSLNGRPRATHDWRNPLEVFALMLANSHQPPSSVQ
jgi:hypothetical protein